MARLGGRFELRGDRRQVAQGQGEAHAAVQRRAGEAERGGEGGVSGGPSPRDRGCPPALAPCYASPVDGRRDVRPALREARRRARDPRARAARARQVRRAASSPSSAASRTRPASSRASSSPSCRPGRRCSSRATRTARTRSTTSSASSPTSSSCTATARFADDAAIVGGLARFRGRSVVVARPPEGPRRQGEREAQLRHAPPRGLPQGAAHVRAGRAASACRSSRSSTPPAPTPASAPRSAGRARPSASCLAAMSRAPVPIVATIIGEGGSGGALALGVANRVLVLEYGMLQRHLARGLRLDPLEGRQQGRRGGDAPEDDRPRSAAPRRRRRRGRRARRRRPPGPRRRRAPRRGGHRRDPARARRHASPTSSSRTATAASASSARSWPSSRPGRGSGSIPGSCGTFRLMTARVTLEGKVAIVTGRQPRHRGGHRADLRRPRGQGRARRAQGRGRHRRRRVHREGARRRTALGLAAHTGKEDDCVRLVAARPSSASARSTSS